MAFQSLYRRYRPQRFGELRGQDHVSVTLRNAVRDGQVSHAYLFSGPRGTGKTSTARILAKALNCTAPDDGEPCGTCGSCVDIAEGRSLDVVELDAASNRGVDAMRDLVARSALGTPGRWKVYIVDEVHMLTTEAASTLLKTLEEPPGHVIFVLATTEPHKVLPTIRSRTQHFEFRLLPIDILSAHLRWVASDAGLDIPTEVIDLVAHKGAGSVRDALSKLDQVAAAGGVEEVGPSTDEMVEALCERDAARALTALAERIAGGHDARHLVTELLEHLRQVFLVIVARGLVGLPDAEVAQVQSQAARLGLPATVKAMEMLGETLVDMREAPDARVLVEVALLRLCRPEVDTSPAALVERLERLERAVAEGGASERPASTAPPRATEQPADRPRPAPGTGTLTDNPAGDPAATATVPGTSPASGARAALGAIRRASAPQASPPPPSGQPTGPPAAPLTFGNGGDTGPAPSAPTPPPTGDPGAGRTTEEKGDPLAAGATATAPVGMPSRDELTLAWADAVLPALSPRAKARFRAGRFVAPGLAGAEEDKAAFALPTAIHRDRCAEVKPEVEQALGRHFKRPVPLVLLVEADLPEGSAPGSAAPHDSDGAPGPPDDEESIDPSELIDAPPSGVTSPIDHVMQVFDGATVVEE